MAVVSFVLRFDGTPKPAGWTTPGMKVLADFLRREFPFPEPAWPGYGYNPRKIAGTNTWSQHASGRALDVRTNAEVAAELAYADGLCDWLVDHAEEIGLQSIIWNGRIWGGPSEKWFWRPFSGRNKHTDHVHFEINLAAGAGLTAGMLEELIVDEAVLVDEVPLVGEWDLQGRFPKVRVFADGSTESINGAAALESLRDDHGVVELAAPVVGAFWDPTIRRVVMEAADGGTFALGVKAD